MSVYYVNGEWRSGDQACLAVDDLAILRGLAVFDFLRTYGGRPFRLFDHLRRLGRSAARIGVQNPLNPADTAAVVHQTLMRNHYPESNIRIVLTGGSSPDGLLPAGPGRLLVMVTPAYDFPPEYYRDGVAVVTTPAYRYAVDAKSTAYIPAVHALQRGRREAAAEALLVTAEGEVTEGATSNLFAVIDDRLTTPAQGLLPGITRQVILEQLSAAGQPVRLAALGLAALLSAAEVFITAANKKVMPVVRIDGRTVADGRPGPITREVMERFAAYARRWAHGLEIETTMV